MGVVEPDDSDQDESTDFTTNFEHDYAKSSEKKVGCCTKCDSYLLEIKEYKRQIEILREKYIDLHKKHETQYCKNNKEINHLRSKVNSLEKSHITINNLPTSTSKKAVKIQHKITEKALPWDLIPQFPISKPMGGSHTC